MDTSGCSEKHDRDAEAGREAVPRIRAQRYPVSGVVATAKGCRERLLPEHRNRDSIKQTSGHSNAHPRLKDVDIHELSEFHIFHGTGGRGINPFLRLREFVARQGIVDARIHFSSVYQFALLRDAGVPLPLHLLPEWFFRISGRLSLSFSLTGTKRNSA